MHGFECKVIILMVINYHGAVATVFVLST